MKDRHRYHLRSGSDEITPELRLSRRRRPRLPIPLLIAIILLLGVGLVSAFSSISAVRPRAVEPATASPAPAAAQAAPTLPPTPAPVVLLPAGPAPMLTTLVYWEQEGDDADAVLDALSAGFMRDHPTIAVRRVHFGTEELRAQFTAATQAGSGPDLTRGPQDFTGTFTAARVIQPAGALYDEVFLDQFFHGALSAATISGTVWAVPDNYGSQLMLLYNKKLVSEVPTETRSWIAQLKTLSDPANGQYGLAYNRNEPYWLAPWIGAFGGWPLDDNDRPDLNNQAVINALQFVQDLNLRDKVLAPTTTYDAAVAMFKAGKAAYLIDGPWNLADYKGAGVDFGLAMLPRLSDTGRDPVPMTTGKYWYFSTREAGPQLQAARQFVAYMTSAAAQQEWLVKLNRLPSNRQAAQSPEVQKDPALAVSVAELSRGRGIPAAPAMWCAWDAMRPGLEAVMAGAKTPAEAAQEMQRAADNCVAPASTPQP